MAQYAFALFVVLLALPVPSASAQGFLDFLFGPDMPAPSSPAGGYVRPRVLDSTRYEPSSPLGELFSASPYDAPAPHAHTAYRTLCVRMCDGFYFPISDATGSANFTRDADRCAASCGGEARLFYYPNPGGNIEGMLDLTGRAYSSYPTAFKYRKTLVQGCQCRPQPWTDAERARHRSYAAALPLPDSQPAVPGPGAAAVGVDDRPAQARPDPVFWQAQARAPDRVFDTGSARTAKSPYPWSGVR